MEKPVSALAAVHYGDVTEAALRHEQWLGALRIPGRAEYLAALDEAVAAAAGLCKCETSFTGRLCDHR